jgi:hypothetical protein
VVFDFPELKQKCEAIQAKPSKVHRNPVILAQEWQNALGNGDYSSPADIARQLSISRARVTQVLRLLKLTPTVLKMVADLGDPLPSPILTERRLRPIVDLPAVEQVERVKTITAKWRSHCKDTLHMVAPSKK